MYFPIYSREKKFEVAVTANIVLREYSRDRNRSLAG